MSDTLLSGNPPEPPAPEPPQDKPDAWMAQLKDDLKANEELKQLGSHDAVARAYLKTKEESGKKISVPGEGATPEEVKSFRKSLGIPESEKGYELSMGEIPQGMQVDEDLVNWFKKVSLEIGLTPKQAQGLLQSYKNKQIEGFQTNLENSSKQAEEMVNQLKNEHKEGYEKYMKGAHEAVLRFGPDGFFELLNNTKIGNFNLGNHPLMIKFCGEIGKLLLEDSSIGGGTPPTPEPPKPSGQIDYRERSPELYPEGQQQK